MQIGGSSTAVRLDRLTSLRFFAAFAVFGFHSTVFFEGPTREVLDAVFGQGRSGVTFFFVLSGFVLAWSSRAGDAPLSFYRRRFARIYPAYIVALLLAAALWALRDPSALSKGPLTPFLLQAWVPDSRTYFAINVPAWSLSVEAFFYLMFPLLILGLRKLSVRWLWGVTALMVVVLTASAAIASQSVSGENLDANSFAVWLAFYFPVARLPEFIFGMTLALLMRRGQMPHIPWSPALGLLAATFTAMVLWPSAYQVAAQCLVPFGILIVSAAQRDLHGTKGWLANRWVVEAGSASYCFYLVHHIFVFRLAQPGFANQGVTGWAALFLALAISLVAAWVLHKVVELRADKWLRGTRAHAPASMVAK